MNFPTKYELNYPIQKTSGPWIVIGYTKDWGMDIHLDSDDPNFEFAKPEDWPELDAATVEQYNLPYRKAFRLAVRRMTVFDRNYTDVMHNHYRAEALMKCWRRIKNGETSVHEEYMGGIIGVSK